jgi:type II secretory pathway pseudopilin PulG
MAIIGILASVISVGMISSRKRAKTTAALRTAESVMGEMAECYLNNKSISPPNSGAGGGQICNSSTIGSYPGLPVSCVYKTVDNTKMVITCNSGKSTITCTVATGQCVKS